MKITEITAEKSETKVQRLAAYCRVSSDSADQLHSFAAQLRYYSNYEKQHPEVNLVGIYADEGLSGTSMKKRAEMNRLIMDCEKGKIDRVITKSVSRFARNTHDLLQTLRLLKSYGVTVFFEEQGIDTAQLNSELFLTFPGMIAQQESVTISENVRWGIQKIMEKGEYIPHVAPYGFEIQNGELAINEEQASIVRRIFDMYLSGIGTQKIADTLNEEGIPTVSGKSKWYRSTVSYIITNERYKGEALLQKRTRTDTLPYRREINKGQKQKYLVENANISIIPRETYDKAQKLLAERQTDNPGNNKPIFSNYIFCSKCGRSFRKIVNRGKAYWMSSVTDASNCICKHTRIKESAIFDAFSMMRFKLADNRESLIDTTIQMIEKLQDNVGNGANDIREIDEKIAKLSAQNHVLAKLHNNGILPAAEFTKQSSEIAYKITELRTTRRKILSESENAETIDELSELNAALMESESTENFDEILFENIVKRIFVINNACIKFSLLGGLEATEAIREKERCKNRV